MGKMMISATVNGDAAQLAIGAKEHSFHSPCTFTLLFHVEEPRRPLDRRAGNSLRKMVHALLDDGGLTLGADPVATAMLHAGVLKKFGLYGLIQIALPLLPALALALGAAFVWIGRPFNYAASIGGHDGVRHAIKLMQSEIERDMMMLGIRALDELGPHSVKRADGTGVALHRGGSKATIEIPCASREGIQVQPRRDKIPTSDRTARRRAPVLLRAGPRSARANTAASPRSASRSRGGRPPSTRCAQPPPARPR